MFAPQIYEGTTTCFDAAKRAVVELLKLKAIQHPDDQVAVVLYNTVRNNTEHVFLSFLRR